MITYPNLPIVDKKDDICQAIAAHPVIIIAGETGSGKTTQLGKMALEMGRGCQGWIGHTQPRRLAARAVAQKIASELNTQLGSIVGFKVRFSDRTSEATQIKLMTDGILLAETQHDPLLKRYDTLIIDEAHERSLNIDFLLGVIKKILKKRDDLKVIITSATIDVEKFSKFFNHAPIIEVSGRTYPVELRYRPSTDTKIDLAENIYKTLQEINTIGTGDVLVFLSGEREIREVDTYLKARLPHTIVLPLYARLSPKEQSKIFEVKGPHRRVILSTNVAETSLTVPNIRFVIDPGLARMSRYSYRSQIQGLPIEPISQASANQRKGRCGRISAGICYRLYSEEDFVQRPLYTEPEILRTNLAHVLLQMLSLRLGHPSNFPFLDAPDKRYIDHGLKVLDQLGAIDEAHRLTRVGRAMARFPIEPRLARILLASQDYHCLKELLIIVSALSIQSPYETPDSDFVDPTSDFLTIVKLWETFQEQKKLLTNRQYKAWCEEKGLFFIRLLEWQDVHEQLNMLCHDMDFHFNEASAEYHAVHKALLTGLIPFIGFKDEKNNYTGPRDLSFRLFFNSSVNAKPPKWVVCFDFIQTRFVFSRLNGKIEPQWIEEVAPHLVKKTYFEPHWNAQTGFVSAYEKVILLGLEIVSKRKINYSKIDPILSHHLFIEQGLVEGEIAMSFKFLEHNESLIKKLKKYEDRFRRKDLLVDKTILKAFYQKILPTDVNNVPALKGWLKQHDERQLYFDEALLLAKEINKACEDFPKTLIFHDETLNLKYHFSPGQQIDGVTLQMTVPQARKLLKADFSGMVMGLMEEKVLSLLKSLPKPIRQNLSPLQSYASAIFENISSHQIDLIACIINKIKNMTGVTLRKEQFDFSRIPEYLSYRFEILDQNGTLLGSGRDLTATLGVVKTQYPDRFTSQFQLRKGLTAWDFGILPKMDLNDHIALYDEGASVAIVRYQTAWEADAAHQLGVSRLLMIGSPALVKYLLKEIPYRKELKAEVEDIILAAFKQIIVAHGRDIRDSVVFQAALSCVKAEGLEVACSLAKHLYTAKSMLAKIRQLPPDVAQQVEHLIFSGYIQSVPYQFLMRYPIYFKAIEVRILKPNPTHERTMQRLWTQYQNHLKALPEEKRGVEAVVEYRWLLEELRVSLYAQQLGTIEPISEKRLQKKWEQILLL
ncbi:MAG: ATP-dependent RNA helicase HrpA [Gammaproteobacteria bacterium]